MSQIIEQVLIGLIAGIAGFILGRILGKKSAARLYQERETELLSQLRNAERDLENTRSERQTLASRVTRLESELTTAQTLLKAREATITEQTVKLKERSQLLDSMAEKDGELTRLRWRLSELEQRHGVAGNIPARQAPSVPYGKDDLKRIQGVGLIYADLLNRMNIFTFRQIAQWNEEDIHRVADLIGEFPDRIRREDWVSNAKEQHFLKYGEKL